jgi:large subunit ribosomal protein L16
MLQPARTKFRKSHRNRGGLVGTSYAGAYVSFGMYGLKATSPGEVSSRQIEAARRAMSHCIKRGGKIWIRIFPHMPITKKASEVPMGSGKGSVEFYTALVRPGRVIFEMDGVTEEIAREAFRLAGAKLPVRTKFTVKHS